MKLLCSNILSECIFQSELLCCCSAVCHVFDMHVFTGAPSLTSVQFNRDFFSGYAEYKYFLTFTEKNLTVCKFGTEENTSQKH